jgi:GT2 family glycosyltransferase
MDLSVLIPTHRRPDAINRCLRRLENQRTGGRFEVIIGLDGDEADTPLPAIPSGLDSNAQVERFGRVGLLKVRQGLLGRARGEIVLWLNDDAYVEPGLLESHLAGHRRPGGARVIAGRAKWKPLTEPSLFDRLVQSSDLVFFSQGDRRRVVDYRNCYGLNMSFPRELAMGAGGIAEVTEFYGYEDIELAWRLSRAGAECVYEPGAVVTHDHRYTPRDVHRREYLLGRAAHAFAHVNPSFAKELFQSDLRDIDTVEPLRTLIQHAWRDGVRIERTFLTMGQLSEAAASDELLPVLAEHWVLLKRLLWRWGVLDASRGIESRWSLLSETSPDQVLGISPIAV